MIIREGDHVIMKKKHPCGSEKWLITRAGADVKLKCLGCGRAIMLDRVDFEKKARRVISQQEGATP